MSENIPYIIAEDGFYYVAYKEKAKVPEIVVSAKGVANGLSEEYNDGWDFGPDSYSSTSTSAIPYTETSGVQEAVDYAVSIRIKNELTGNYWIPEIHLVGTDFKIYKQIVISAPSGINIENLKIKGMSSMAPYIAGYLNNEYMIAIDFNNFNDANLRFEDLQPYVPSGYTPSGFITIMPATSSNEGNGNIFEGYNIDISNSGWTDNPLNLINFEGILMYNYQAYSNNSSGNFSAGSWITFIGGMIPSGSTLYLSGSGNSSSFGAPTVNLIGVSGSGGSQGTNLNLNTIFTLDIIGSMFIGQITLSDEVAVNAGFSFTMGSLTIVDAYITINSTDSFLNASSSQNISKLSIKTNTLRLLNSPTTTVNFSNNVSASIVELEIPDIQLNGNSLANIPMSSIVPSTPAVPASGTAQQNTNTYPVKVYISGGALTEVQITIGGTSYTVYSNSTASAVYEGFTLPAGASITLTYTTAPTWSWVPE